LCNKYQKDNGHHYTYVMFYKRIWKYAIKYNKCFISRLFFIRNVWSTHGWKYLYRSYQVCMLIRATWYDS